MVTPLLTISKYIMKNRCRFFHTVLLGFVMITTGSHTRTVGFTLDHFTSRTINSHHTKSCPWMWASFFYTCHTCIGHGQSLNFWFLCILFPRYISLILTHTKDSRTNKPIRKHPVVKQPPREWRQELPYPIPTTHAAHRIYPDVPFDVQVPIFVLTLDINR